MLEGLAALVDKSLLQQEAGPVGETRYLMLETIREYGLEQLAARGDEGAAHRRQARWCLDLAERAAA